MTKTKDRRYIRSQKSIQEAFLDMISKKKYSTITIKDIADQADVSRSTFYLHYKKKEDIIYQIMEDFYSEILQWFEENKPVKIDKAFNKIFTILYGEKEKFQLLINSGLDLLLLETSQNFCNSIMNKHIIEDFSQGTPYFNDYVAGGFYMVIYSWYKNEMKEKPEEMAKICAQLIKNLS